MPVLDLSPDELLTTTRSVRRRLDCSRPVEPEVIRQCLEIALQAPTGGNRQGWHFVVVTDAEKRQPLAISIGEGSPFTVTSPRLLASSSRTIRRGLRSNRE